MNLCFLNDILTLLTSYLTAEPPIIGVSSGRKLTAGERIRLARQKAQNNRKEIAIGTLGLGLHFFLNGFFGACFLESDLRSVTRKMAYVCTYIICFYFHYI